ncbi:MAG: hypothetical protein HWE14_03050 [Flavobacteriia bacterium]|nr:hypothetical protein [Flavobacteriia bacterium]
MLPYPEDEIRAFYDEHRHEHTADLLLKAKPEDREKIQWMIEQIATRKKLEVKVPEWASRFDLYLPPVENLSQASSSLTAMYKSQKMSGNILDLTLGSGVDSWQIGQMSSALTAIEPNEELAMRTKFNLEKLGVKMNLKLSTAEEFIDKNRDSFDWIYIDPSRRNEDGKRTVALHRMTPDLTALWPSLLASSKHICVKLSPLFDITAIINELSSVYRIEIIAVKGEVKEILVFAGKVDSPEVEISASELHGKGWTFSSAYFRSPAEGDWGGYLYDPSAAMIKSGLADEWAYQHELSKPLKDVNLYASDFLHESFPGRVFRIVEKSKPYKLKNLPQRLAIVSRYYHERPEVIRKRLKVQESDSDFLFAVGKGKKSSLFIHAMRVI